MSKKNNYYSDIKIIKGKKSRFLKVLGILFFCFVFVLFSYSMSLILGKTLSVSSGVSKNDIKFYALSFANFSDEKDASEYVKVNVSMGAGGYIYSKNNKYYVLGAIYLNKKDAQSVLNSNIQSMQNAEIIEFSVDKKQYDFKDDDFDKLIKVVNGLYENIIKFDNGSLNYIALASKINELDGECCVILNNNNGNKFYSDVILVEKILNNLTSTILLNQNVGSCIKYAIIQIVDLIAF